MPTIPYKNAQGKRVSGVTTVIGGNLGWNKNPLIYTAWKRGTEGIDYKDLWKKEADAGTIAHAMIEAEIKGKEFIRPDGLPNEVINKAETCYLNFLDWKGHVEFEAVEVEPHLVSERYQVGATPDVIPRIKGKLSLLDWKTGNDLKTYEDMLIQISAYKEIYEEVREIKIDGGFYLLKMLKENASWAWYHWDVLEEAWEAFKHCLALHDLKKKIK